MKVSSFSGTDPNVEPDADSHFFASLAFSLHQQTGFENFVDKLAGRYLLNLSMHDTIGLRVRCGHVFGLIKLKQLAVNYFISCRKEYLTSFRCVTAVTTPPTEALSFTDEYHTMSGINAGFGIRFSKLGINVQLLQNWKVFIAFRIKPVSLEDFQYIDIHIYNSWKHQSAENSAYGPQEKPTELDADTWLELHDGQPKIRLSSPTDESFGVTGINTTTCDVIETFGPWSYQNRMMIMELNCNNTLKIYGGRDAREVAICSFPEPAHRDIIMTVLSGNVSLQYDMEGIYVSLTDDVTIHDIKHLFFSTLKINQPVLPAVIRE